MTIYGCLELLTSIAEEHGLTVEIHKDEMKLGAVEFTWSHYAPEEAFQLFLLQVVDKYGLPKYKFSLKTND